MIEFIVKWWFVIVDTVIDFIDTRSNERLSKISNLMAITLMLVGFTTWALNKRKKRKNKGIMSKVASNTKPPKYLTFLDDPFSKGEELGEMTESLYEGGKKMKNVFKKIGHALYVSLVWLKGNWENLYSAIYTTIGLIITNLVFYMDGLHRLFGDNALWTTNIYVKIAVLGLSVLGAITTWFTTATKDKFYSFKTLCTRMEEKEKELEERKLTKNQQAKVKALKDKIQSNLDVYVKQINELTTKLEDMSRDYNTCHALVPNYNEERIKIEREIERLIPLKIELETTINEIDTKEE